MVSKINEQLPFLTWQDSRQNLLDGGICFVFRKAPTIGTLLSPSLFDEKTEQDKNWLSGKGFYNCGHRICTASKHIKNNCTFTSMVTQKTYTIKNYLNFNSKSFICLVTCKLCNVQYVGCTTTLLEICIQCHLSDTLRPLTFNVRSQSIFHWYMLVIPKRWHFWV